jgi:hypothetical protein
MRQIAFSVSEDVYAEMCRVADEMQCGVGGVARHLALASFAPDELDKIQSQPRRPRGPKIVLVPEIKPVPDVVRAPPAIVMFDHGYVPPKVGAIISDADIAEMARHKFHDSYICGRYRLPWARVSAITVKERAAMKAEAARKDGPS